MPIQRLFNYAPAPVLSLTITTLSLDLPVLSLAILVAAETLQRVASKSSLNFQFSGLFFICYITFLIWDLSKYNKNAVYWFMNISSSILYHSESTPVSTKIDFRKWSLLSALVKDLKTNGKIIKAYTRFCRSVGKTTCCSSLPWISVGCVKTRFLWSW